MMKFPVALQVYSVRDVAEKDFEATLRKIKEFGYDGVEFAGLYGYDPDDVAKMCNDIGLVPISAHVPLSDLMGDTEKTVSDYAKVGCKYIAIPYLPEQYRPGKPGFSDVLKAAVDIGTVCKRYGIKLLYHNHDFEFVKDENGVYGLDFLYESVPAELLETELDTCWVNVGGEDPAAYVKKYSGRAPLVHLKDFVGGKTENMYGLLGLDEKKSDSGEFQYRPLGCGVQNFPEILAASENAGTSWVVVEQDEPSMGKSSMECAKISIDYLRGL